MRVEAIKFEKSLKSVGSGSWGRLEFENNDVVLRIMGVKQAEGRVQLYFDGKREQIVSHGRLYSPMTSHRPYYFRAGVSYLITTQVNLVKPLPKGIEGRIVGNSHLAIMGGIITSGAVREAGVVEYSLYCTRKAEVMEMITLCSLVFEDVSGVKPEVTAKSNKGKDTSKKKGGKNENSTTIEPSSVSEK